MVVTVADGSIERTSAADVDRTTALLLLIVATALGLWFRLENLATDSFWFDEAASWNQSRGTFDEMLAATARDNYPPLHNIILNLVIHNFGDSEWWLRLPSAIAGALTIPAVYWVAAMLHSRRGAVLAAVIIALSHFHVDYSQEARMYALLGLAATLSFGTTLAFLLRPNIGWAVAAVLSGAALTYSHPFGGITWVSTALAFAAFALFSPMRSLGRIVGLVLIQLAIGAIFLPWALILVARANTIIASGFWIPYPTAQVMLSQFTSIVSGELALVVLGSAVAVYALWTGRGRAGETPAPAIGSRWALLLLLAWAVGPWLIAEVASISLRPIVHERYLNCLLPAICVLVGIGLGSLLSSRGQLVASAVALGVGLSISVATTDKWHNDDWRGAARHIASQLQPGDCIGLAPGWLDAAFRYYFRDADACVVGMSTPDDATAVPDGTSRLHVAFQYAEGFRDALTARLAERWPVHSTTSFSGIDVETFQK